MSAKQTGRWSKHSAISLQISVKPFKCLNAVVDKHLRKKMEMKLIKSRLKNMNKIDIFRGLIKLML